MATVVRPCFIYLAGSKLFLEHELPGTSRGSPFTHGEHYRVVAPGPSFNGSLTVGEVLTYVSASYGCYDGVSVYVFVTADGQERTWMLYDDEPLELWVGVFEVVRNTA